KERLLSLGPWPDVSLTMARSKAETLRKQIELGEDPAARRKREVAARIESREKTVGVVGMEVLALDDRKAPRTRRKHERLFELLRSFHARPIRALRTPEIVTVLRKIQEHHDRRETAHRAAGFINRICRYAKQSGYIEANPADDLRGALKPIKVQSHAAA